MHRDKKRRKLIIFSLLGVLLLMSVGYAAFQTSFQIKGSTQITSNWDVEITNISDPILTGSAKSLSKMIGDDKLSASMEAELFEKGDTAEYIVTIENKGTIDAKLEDIVGSSSNSEAVLITFSGYSKGERLYKNGQEGSVKQIHVKIEYNPTYEGKDASGEANVNFNYVQAEGGTIEPKNTYLLTYDYKTNGGNNDNETASYDEGSSVDLTKTAIKNGWTFIGWNTNKDATEGLTNLTITNNTTLYAIYKKEINATFDKNGSTSIGSTNLSCNMYNNQTSCVVKAPSITRDGYTVIGWNKDKNATTSEANINTNINLSSNVKYYAITKNNSAYTASWNANGATLSSTEAKSCNTYNTETTCTVDTPTITRDGYDVIGFNTNSGATTSNNNYRKSTNKLVISGSGTWYAVTKNHTFFVANWDANGATLSSTVSQICYIYNTETTCTVDAPTITAPANTPTVLGFNTSANSNSNNSAYNASTNKLTISGQEIWYAQTTKTKVTLTAKWNANGAVLSSTANKTCDLAATFNGVAQATSCQVDAPTITAPANTPTVLGFNTSANSNSNNASYNTSDKKLTLTSSNNNSTWYAQTTKAKVTLTASWNANGATLSSTTAKTCDLAATFNGTKQNTTCQVDAPTITRNGFTITGFNTSASSTTNNSSYNTSTKKLTISGNNTWYAITKKDVTLTFVKGANTASIGSTSGSCTIQNTATSCSVKTPSITSNDTYVPVGWSTTNGATTGVAAGSNITGLTSNATYYGNSIADNVSLTLSTSSTTSTITITANAQATSGIKSYAYKIDGNNATCKSGTASNICIIQGLTHNTTHTASVTVTANSNKTATSSKSVTTVKIDTPTFKDTETASGVDVNVTYPSGCTNYTCQYSLNGGASWITVTTTPYKVSFTESGSIIARVTDKTNTNNVVTSSSHTVEVIKGVTAESLKKNAKTSGTDNGLYIDTSEGITRYIYKGDNNVNNYIYIKENNSNVKYRIYSIESDNTIKVIRDEAVTSMYFDVRDASRRIGGYCNRSHYCNAWAAMDSFTSGTTKGFVSLDSSIKEYIDDTYSKTLTDSSKIVSKTWNIAGTAYNRDTLEIAIADEKKSTWNGNIALLTASEYVRANTNTTSCGTLNNLDSNYSTCKGSNYLFKSSTWWLLSPAIGSRREVLRAYSDGNVNKDDADVSYGVRPSFYLCSGLTFSGEGTNSSPYEISGGSCTK